MRWKRKVGESNKKSERKKKERNILNIYLVYQY